MAPRRTATRSRSTSTRPSSEPTRRSTHSKSRSQSTSARYAHLAPRTLHISRRTILKKWRPLPPPTQERIRTAILSIAADSKARRRKTVIRAGKNGLKDLHKLGEQEDEGEAVVDDVVRRLVGRVGKMPFPTKHSRSKAGVAEGKDGSGDMDFNLEALLTRVGVLRSTMTSNTQSVRLLKAQIAREEKALKRDRAELKGLEEGVRREREVAGREARSYHAVARGLETTGYEEEDGTAGAGSIGSIKMEMQDDDGDEMMDNLIPTAARTRQRRKNVALTNEAIDKDEDLAPLVKQLRSHLGSMQGNVAGLAGLREELGRAEGVVMKFDARKLKA